MTSRLYRRVLATCLASLALPFAWSVLAGARGGAAAPSLEGVPIASRCVAEPATMRFEHMRLLREARDRVVREGRRSPPPLGVTGLAQCMGCHGDPTSFCDRCHEPAGVRLDCFGCHRR